MERELRGLHCEFDYTNKELQMMSEAQVLFSGGLSLLSEIEEIGAIKWTRVPIDADNTRVIAHIDILMP